MGEKYTALEIKAKVAHHLRYIEQCPMVAFEASSRLSAFNDGGQSDIMAINKLGMVKDIEVKITMSDLNRDRLKAKHRWLSARLDGERMIAKDLYPIHYFYFAVPYELGNKASEACEKHLPYAGVLGIRKSSGMYQSYVSTFRAPKLIPNPRLLIDNERLARMGKSMSASLVRLAMELAGVEMP